jgi:hypothetical protein
MDEEDSVGLDLEGSVGLDADDSGSSGWPTIWEK